MMKYTKECLSGRDVDLRQFNLGLIKQITVDKLMGEYDLIDFIKPFFLEQNLDLNESIRQEKIHFNSYLYIAREDFKIIEELIIALKFLYGTDDVDMCEFYDGYRILIKINGTPIAFIDNSNFNELCEMMLEICHFEKPKSKPEMKGDPKLVKRMKEARKKYEKEHASKNSIHFEEMVRQVMYYRKLSYNDIKAWTVWQVKDVFMVECLMEASDKSYLLATNSNASVDLKKVKRWQDETKLIR